MQIRWHKSWLVAVASTACALNPQPDLPGDKGIVNTGSGGAGGAIGISVPGAGYGATGTGESSGAPTAAAGARGVSGPDAEAGAGGASEAGAPGEGPVVGQGGAR